MGAGHGDVPAADNDVERVRGWLEGLGLGAYAGLFAESGIDLEVLPDLTDADLRELGLPLGPRKKLLKAVATLSDRRSESEPITIAARPPEAERRQLTVLFCDLVGSTELSGRLDPEDMSALVRAYHSAVAGEIERFEGHVAKYMGDGVLAYFGWPQAHEDDAERAVRAGLAVVEAVGKIATPIAEPLTARVGIATGQVVVGELIGAGAAQEEAVIGDTPNLAARLQALAQPGSVVISQATRRLVGGLFELADLGPLRLKGFAEPLVAWRVAGEGQAEGRFEALHGEHLTPLVGREPELGMLLERWAWAKEGDGQVVLLAGEPGIGKSRLIRALRERLAGQAYMPLGHYCSPYHTDSALYPVIGLLERAAGFERDDPPEARLAKLEALLALGSDRLDEVVPLVAALLDVPVDEKYPPLNLTPQRQKQRTLEVLVNQVAGLAARQPVLALYEDAHWMDPTTREALSLLIARAPGAAVLVLITFRPEFQPPWAGHAHVTQLSLARLTRRHGAEVALSVSGGKPLPEAVLEQIVATTDGVPLFVEELTKTVLESGLLRDAGDRWELAGALPPLAIPDSLHDSLMARLDRLGPVKEIAQTGAVIGREFSHGLLAAVAPLPEDKLCAALDELVRAELIFRRGIPPDATYTFKHVLVRDAAYESLLKSRRRDVHARVVQALEARSADTAAAEPEVLAHHCAQAGLMNKAVDYRYRAGQQAIARSAMAEAVEQLNHGIEALTSLPDGPERGHRELDLQIALGGALIAAKGYAAPETGRAFVRARDLCREQGDVHRLLPVLNGQVLFHNERGERRVAYEIAAEMLELAQREGRSDAALLIPAHRALSLTLSELGRFSFARQHAEEVLALYDPARHRSLVSFYTFDQRVVALGYLAWTLFALGYPDQSRRRSAEQLTEARELAHPNTLAQALYRACIFNRHARDAEGLREAAEALVAVAAEHGLSFFLAIGRLHRGWLLIHQGRAEQGLSEVQRGAAEAEAAGTELGPAYLNGLIAEAYTVAGRHREAVSWTAKALAEIGNDASPWWERGSISSLRRAATVASGT